MPEPRDIALVYAPPWDGPTRFSKHHLARYLARETGSRVLYIEAPLTPLGLRRGRAFASELLQTQQPPRRVGERLWVRRHFVPIPYHALSRLTSRRAANRLGQRLLAPVMRRDLARLGFSAPILIAGLPHAVDLLDRLPHRLLVYHCADDYAQVRSFPRTLPALEAELCRRADLVVTTSEQLCQARRQFNPSTYWIANGVEVDHFARAVGPAAELHGIRRPVLGFIGGLSEWVDIDLLQHLARARPDWSLVLVGPVGVDVSLLRELPNVHLLGPRAYERLPAHLAGMDVALIPFLRNPLTFSADPIKVYEYLAAGRPVVATDLPALRRLEHVVRLARSADEFVRQVEAALAEDAAATRRMRQTEAAGHSWQARFADLDQLLQAAAARRRCGPGPYAGQGRRAPENACQPPTAVATAERRSPESACPQAAGGGG